MTGISSTHMPVSIECSTSVPSNSSAGNTTGPETSALRWLSYALAILCRLSLLETSLSVHIAPVPTTRQSTWCYSVQLMTSPGGMSGLEENLPWILDVSGTLQRGLGWFPLPSSLFERAGFCKSVAVACDVQLSGWSTL